MPEGFQRRVWPSCSVAESPSLAKVVPTILIAPDEPSTTSAVSVSDPATRGTRVGSAVADVFVNGTSVSDEISTNPEDIALMVWPLIVAIGPSEWIV